MRNENGNSRNYGNEFEKESGKGSLIVGLITGAVAGAVTALLLAPNSGEETRRKLMRTTGKLRNDINETVQSGIDRINELRGSLGEDVLNGPSSGRLTKSANTSSKNSGTSDSGAGMASGSGISGSSTSGSGMSSGYSGTETSGFDSSASGLNTKTRGGTL